MTIYEIITLIFGCICIVISIYFVWFSYTVYRDRDKMVEEYWKRYDEEKKQRAEEKKLRKETRERHNQMFDEELKSRKKLITE